MAERSTMEWIASVLVVVGALNWGLVGLRSFGGISYEWDVVALVLGGIPWLAAVVYLLIAVSGVWLLARLFKE